MKLKLVKRILTGRGPQEPFRGLPGELVQWLSDTGVVLDEPTIVIRQSQELSEFFDVCWGRVGAG